MWWSLISAPASLLVIRRSSRCPTSDGTSETERAARRGRGWVLACADLLVVLTIFSAILYVQVRLGPDELLRLEASFRQAFSASRQMLGLDPPAGRDLPGRDVGSTSPSGSLGDFAEQTPRRVPSPWPARPSWDRDSGQ